MAIVFDRGGCGFESLSTPPVFQQMRPLYDENKELTEVELSGRQEGEGDSVHLNYLDPQGRIVQRGVSAVTYNSDRLAYVQIDPKVGAASVEVDTGWGKNTFKLRR